jgi:hypothetical protein
MGSKENRNRVNWQTTGQAKADGAEYSFYEVFEEYFKGTKYTFTRHPKDFENIYTQVPLSASVSSTIYTPQIEIKKHGIKPDFSITNTESGKILYGEVKRQDGWVENKTAYDGRGNAHERLCKYFTTGLLKLFREKGYISDKILPFWVVFEGDITRDPKRVREIHFWFDKYIDNFTLWQDQTNKEILIKHFNEKLKPYLN